jgi:hypothetical protein
MSNKAHFFDLNCLLDTNQKAWIVNKKNPNQPLYKLSPSEFRLIKNGIYQKQGNKIEFNGTNYYLPDNLWNKLKVLSSKNRINLSDFVISLQEFLNKELIEEMDYELKLKQILDLKNEMDDIYIICSKQTRNLYQKLIEEIVEELRINGIKIKNFYYLNENFLNQNSDELYFKKIKLLLQHSVGYKSDTDKFTDFEITKYDFIHLYDKSLPKLNLSSSIKHIFTSMMRNTEKGLSDVIKDDFTISNPSIYIHRIEDNEYNPTHIDKIDLSLPHLIKRFEAFDNFKSYL